MDQKVIKVDRSLVHKSFAELSDLIANGSAQNMAGFLNATELENLKSHRREFAAQEFLKSCIPDKLLRCSCDRVCHIRRPYQDKPKAAKAILYTLARNRSAVGDCAGQCALSPLTSSATITTEAERQKIEKLTRPQTLGLLVRSTRVSEQDLVPEGQNEGISTDRERKARQTLSKSDLALCGTLYLLLENAGLNSFDGKTFGSYREGWAAIFEELKKHRVPGSKVVKPLSDFAWLPLYKSFPHGQDGLLKASKGWPLERCDPEGLILGVSEDLEDVDTQVFRYFSGAEVERRESGQKYAGGQFFQPFPTIKKWVMSGPYLVIGSYVVRDGKVDIVRALAIGILEDEHFIPMDSDFEREVANLLTLNRVPFRKPLFPDKKFRPDFILPDHNAYIEVQGRNDAEYIEHKEKILQAMAKNKHWGKLKQLRYDPNRGEKLSDFVTKKIGPYLKEWGYKLRLPDYRKFCS